MTQRVTSNDPTPEQIYDWIQNRYARILTPQQLDLVRHYLFNPAGFTATGRAFSRTHKLVSEARAVLSAGGNHGRTT